MENTRMMRFRKRIRFSFRFWLISFFFLSSFFFLMFQGGKLAFMLFNMVSIICIYLVLGKWSGIAKATGSRKLSIPGEHLTIESGTKLPVQLEVSIPGFWPIPYVFVTDQLMKKNGEAQLYESSFVPNWHRKGVIQYIIPPLTRGIYHFGATRCSTEDVFGIFKHSGSISMPRSFGVLPKTIEIQEWQQFHKMMKGMQHHSLTTRAQRETTQINGVREYIYGDRISKIHWNATARTGNWKSKEFERESLPKTIIVLDRKKDRYKDKEQFELAVSVTASLIHFCQRKELALGLLSVGHASTYLDPQNGSMQHHRMMDHLMEVEADGNHDLEKILQNYSKSFISGTFFVLVTPQIGEELGNVMKWLAIRQMKYSHISISSLTSLKELPSVLGGNKYE